ncbi:MAG: transposase [Candidatus Omnitrophota bacterium]|nr:transposase [Candidatus Omnitrophota bacterium]
MPYTARSHQLKQSLIYHIFNRGINREKIFLDEEDYSYFIKLLREYSQRASLSIYHWVLMPNHYHIVTAIEEPEKISSVMAGLGRSYACYHHRKHKTAGYLWQGRFKSQPIQKELYLMACGRYVERNPVKAGIIEAAWEYPYSSARFYASGF